MRKKLISFVSVLLLSMFVMCGIASAGPAGDWYWISSDDKYSKYYSPSQIQTEKFGEIAFKIKAWTRTDYAPGGAAETLNNYGISDIAPQQLKYSLAEIEINPQNRTLAYVNETFYDENDMVLWQKDYNPIKPKEMNSQEFDEDFYVYIVDSVFDSGEVSHRKAADRWLTLWTNESSRSMADTTTMRMKGDNLIFWEWQEFKNGQGSVQEIKFQKVTVNLRQAMSKVNRYQHWDSSHGWQDLSKNTDGMYHTISLAGEEGQGLQVLREYAAQHNEWLCRYSLE